MQARCPWCNKSYNINIGDIGKNTKCKSCNKAFTVKIYEEPKATSQEDEQFSRANIERENNPLLQESMVKQDGVTRGVAMHSVPERFHKYLNKEDEIVYASHPSVPSLLLRLILPVLCLVVSLCIAIFLYMSALLGCLFWVVVIACYYYSWKFTYYIVTEKTVFSSFGVFNRRITMIPCSHIQMISVNTGIIDSLLGLNTLELASASNGGGGNIFFAFPFKTPGTIVFRNIEDSPYVCKIINAFTQ